MVKPIVYGNVARYLGKKREEDGHTHQWTVYVKPYNNEDMSAYVKKVHFKLHESYANQNRIVVKPPYEITETGWGEFEFVIKIHFIDPNERPVRVGRIVPTDRHYRNVSGDDVSHPEAVQFGRHRGPDDGPEPGVGELRRVGLSGSDAAHATFADDHKAADAGTVGAPHRL